MTNASKAKGTKFETDVCRFLAGNGFPNVERRALAGALDRGDIGGMDGWVVECKATRAIELGTSMAEAEREARNAGTLNHLLVVKRRLRAIADAYAVMPLWLAADTIRRSRLPTDPQTWERP